MSENNKSAWMQSLTTAYPKFQSINPEKAKSELGFAMQIFQNNVKNLYEKYRETSHNTYVVNNNGSINDIHSKIMNIVEQTVIR